MSPDRRFFVFLKRKEPRQFGLFMGLIRIGALVVIFIALLSGVAEFAHFRGKWMFDGPNSYPLSDFVLYELGATLGVLVAGRLWILSLMK